MLKVTTAAHLRKYTLSTESDVDVLRRDRAAIFFLVLFVQVWYLYCIDRFPGEVLVNSLTQPVCLSLCSWGYISSELVLCSGVNVHVRCFGLACSSVHEQGRMTDSAERPVTLIVCSFWSRLHTDNTFTIVICKMLYLWRTHIYCILKDISGKILTYLYFEPSVA